MLEEVDIKAIYGFGLSFIFHGWIWGEIPLSLIKYVLVSLDGELKCLLDGNVLLMFYIWMRSLIDNDFGLMK